MSHRKAGLAPDEHRVTVAELRAMNHTVAGILGRLSAGYPNDGTLVAQAQRLGKAIRALRYAVADRASREHGLDVLAEATANDDANVIPIVRLPGGRP